MANANTNSAFSLSNPPLICVVARVQFMSVIDMGQHIPALQEKLRLIDFPNFKIDTARTFHVGGLEEGEVKLNVDDLQRWSFSNLDYTIAIQIDKNGLSLIFGDYSDFASAEEIYRKILTIVEESVPALICTGFQLRYVNHIPEPEDPSKWVNLGVLGLPNMRGLKRMANVSETSFATLEQGQLVVRCSVLPKGSALPPDLLPLTIKLKHELQCEYQFITLEAIHMKGIKPIKFTSEMSLENISSLRPSLSEAFQQTITPTALEKWQ